MKERKRENEGTDRVIRRNATFQHSERSNNKKLSSTSELEITRAGIKTLVILNDYDIL